MKREEAIKCIQGLSYCLRNSLREEQKEALDMAIEALQAKTDGDLISRADAIEAVRKLIEEPRQYYTQYNNGIEHSVKALSALPSADRPSGEWIPCSERLPKEKVRVLTYDTMGDVVFGQYDKGRWYWEAEACADYWAKNDGVIAWMPLPKPYCLNCGAKMGSD